MQYSNQEKRLPHYPTLNKQKLTENKPNNYHHPKEYDD